jgi:serine/threonine protein kinase
MVEVNHREKAVEAAINRSLPPSFGGLIADPIAFPAPIIHQSIMARVPVTISENNVEMKIVMETSTGNFYETVRKLRDTIFGQVIHAIQLRSDEHGRLHRANPVRQLAIKVYYRCRLRSFKNKTHENPTSEIAVMQFIGKHQNVVGLLECCGDRDNIYSIMEFADGGELYDYIEQEGPISEIRAWELFGQIVLGLRHLHDAGIAHRDLTLENVMYSRSGVCKLIDFGMSLRLPRVPSDEKSNQFGNDDKTRPVLLIPPQGTCGKPNYIAPEVLENTESFNPQVSDIWSLGVLLFIMLTGVPPVAVAYDLDDRYRLICNGGLGQMLRQWGFLLSNEAVDLLHNLLRPNPADRLTIKEIIEHPWIKKCNTSNTRTTQQGQDQRNTHVHSQAIQLIQNKNREPLSE